MQCNAMQGKVCNARFKGRLLIRELISCADRPRHRSVSHSVTQRVAAARRHIRHRQANAGPCACPFCPSCLVIHTPGSLGKCMQVLRTQSNLPTLLLSISLVPCSLGRIQCTQAQQENDDALARESTDNQPTREQQESTALPFCPCLECLDGTGKLDIAVGPATSAPASLTFIIPRDILATADRLFPNLITARHQISITPPVTSQKPSFTRRPYQPPRVSEVTDPHSYKQLSWSKIFFPSFSFLCFLILLG